MQIIVAVAFAAIAVMARPGQPSPSLESIVGSSNRSRTPPFEGSVFGCSCWPWNEDVWPPGEVWPRGRTTWLGGVHCFSATVAAVEAASPPPTVRPKRSKVHCKRWPGLHHWAIHVDGGGAHSLVGCVVRTRATYSRNRMYLCASIIQPHPTHYLLDFHLHLPALTNVCAKRRTSRPQK